jgi:hypothetical protein
MPGFQPVCNDTGGNRRQPPWTIAGGAVPVESRAEREDATAKNTNSSKRDGTSQVQAARSPILPFVVYTYFVVGFSSETRVEDTIAASGRAASYRGAAAGPAGRARSRR